MEAVVRSLTTAAKTLRLYPPSSPIPMQAMQSAGEAIATLLGSQPTLAFVVARNGFTYHGTDVTAAGAGELANMLTSHGVAELVFLPGCTNSELVAFLGAIMQDPAQLHADGRVAGALSLAGVSNIIVSEVVLTTAAAVVAEGDDVDLFLRELAADESKLAAWIAATASGDPAALSDGLAELARAVGPGGVPALEAALGKAYLSQDVVARDALVGLAIGNGDSSDVLKGMMTSLRPNEVAGSLADGLYAKNMLSMSNVLSAIPFASLDAIIDEIRPMLADEGHSGRELEFLNHMLDARKNAGREVPLASRQPDYQRVAELASIDATTLESARTEIGSSKSTLNTRTVNTMLSLLDQHQDFGLWSKTLQNLASIVPRLIEQRELALADRVFADLAGRESRTTQPWPGLAEQMLAAQERATSPAAMTALLTGVLDDPGQFQAAESILRRVGIAAQQRFVIAAIDQRQRNGLDTAEHLLGRRLVGLLGALAPDVQWFQAGEVAARLANEPDPGSQKALMALIRRPDERSRHEVAKSLGSSSATAAVSLLAELMKDPALEVAVSAARSLGHTPAPGAATALEQAFVALDSFGKDFPLAREILGALARTPDQDATRVLERIAAQRTLIKRGHFAEIQDLARQALASRSKGGAPR
ncbi:MAG: HEAT repeat domain-containing protein [Actinobacteria bacterium]|nr:HEAT repeat domain-containing protein [Actinomycetota bacterium]